MVEEVIRKVLDHLETQGIMAERVRDNLVGVGWDLDFEGGSINTYLKFGRADNLVRVEGMNFIEVPAEKYDSIYRIMNECNDHYRWVKFVLDTQHGQIIAIDDEFIRLDFCGEECLEIMARMVRIVSEAYPEFMKAIEA